MYIKYITILFLSCIFLTSCVDDDICDQGTTPRLSVKITNPENKPDSLFIDKLNTDGSVLSLGVFINVDSLKLPLNTSLGETSFSFYYQKDATKNEKDIVSIKYQTEQVFASKACGLKNIFKNIGYTLVKSVKIKQLTSNSTEINNESETNLYIVY